MVCKNLLSQELHFRFPARDVVPCPPYFIYYISDYFKFFYEFLTCEEKRVIEMPKRTMGFPYLNGRDHLEGSLAGTPDISLSAELLMRKFVDQ